MVVSCVEGTSIHIRRICFSTCALFPDRMHAGKAAHVADSVFTLAAAEPAGTGD